MWTILFVGLKEIQQLVRQSIKRPPFSLDDVAELEASTKITPPPIKEIYTDLKLTRKRRKAHCIRHENLESISGLLTEELDEDCSLRILVEGKPNKLYRIGPALFSLIVYPCPAKAHLKYHQLFT